MISRVFLVDCVEAVVVSMSCSVCQLFVTKMLRCALLCAVAISAVARMIGSGAAWGRLPCYWRRGTRKHKTSKDNNTQKDERKQKQTEATNEQRRTTLNVVQQRQQIVPLPKAEATSSRYRRLTSIGLVNASR